MQVIMLSNIQEELQNTQEATLYGLQEKDAVVISSLHPQKGLERMGVYHQDRNAKGGKKELLEFSKKQHGLSCSQVLEDGTIQDVEVEVVNYTSDFNKRNHGIIDESVLQEREVTIIGQGSGGSAIADYLVRCGVTNLNLVEFDRVSISNLCRSVYTITDVGRKKTECMHEKLMRINPNINVQLYDEDFMEMDSGKLMDIIKSSDLIIEATDNPKTKLLINGLAYASTPVIYPAVYEFGKGGDVLYTLPGLPCFECVFHSIIPEMTRPAEGGWDYTTGQPKPMPALIADIQIIVARTVKLALAILTGDTDEDSLVEKIMESGCSLLLISNERGGVDGFTKPFEEAWVATKINPECTCQTLK